MCQLYFKTLAISLVGILFFPSTSHAQDTPLSLCIEVLKNEPGDSFCMGYKKGYDAATASSRSQTISGTFEQNGTVRFGIFEPKNPNSGTVGLPAFEPFMVTLPSNYRELIEAGDPDWATISDPNTSAGANPTVQLDLGDGAESSGVLQLKQSVGIEAFIQDDAAKRLAIESLKPYIKELGADTIGTQILVRESPAAN